LDPVVKLEQIDALHGEPLQALVERAGNRPGDVVQIVRVQPELRADLHVRLQRLQHLPEIALGLAVAVRRRGVEIVDAELHRPRDRALSLRRCSTDDEPADVAAAEPERRDRETRLAETPRLHACASLCGRGHYSPTLSQLSSRANSARVRTGRRTHAISESR